jgi:hypothetical protein
MCLKLDNKHSIVPLEDIMEILQIRRNSRMMNTLEMFCIYSEMIRQSDNDKRPEKPNAIFDAVIQSNTGRGCLSL